MKKVILCAVFGLFSLLSYGQWSPISNNNIWNTNSGNVGIGNENPKYKLHISNPGSAASILVGNEDPDGTVLFLGNSAEKNGYNLIQSVKSSGSFYGDLSLNRDGGNVGIGTATPKEKLDVAGTIRAREVKIEVNAGADHVFAEDYALKPLSEVESFVKENKHLPEIPSEKQMQEEGLSVNEFQIKLLQKIEELTLYTIQLEKRINELEKE